MIYGKLWLVVKPTVGIPVFLGAVAIAAFLVHYMLLTHTTWLPRYLNGPAPVVAQADTAAPAAPPAVAAPKK